MQLVGLNTLCSAYCTEYGQRRNNFFCAVESIAGSVSPCSHCLMYSSANTLCNFTMFSVSVHTQIGAVGGAEHTPTTERETGRTIVFLVTEFQRNKVEASVGRVSPSHSCTVNWATVTYCYRHG